MKILVGDEEIEVPDEAEDDPDKFAWVPGDVEVFTAGAFPEEAAPEPATPVPPPSVDEG